RAGTRCTVDCPIEAECPQSAKKYFLDYPERWKAYAWECLEYLGEP
ncbi:MAG TPA: gfo/Idh/MocA family oxidoreductase, partial [Clostridiales bacterium]|nr:gfo/Idh/MocA family oxidoreductase [Clostridiales bacterium]